LPYCDVLDAITDPRHRPRGFGPRHERHRGLDLVLTSHEQRVDVVDAGRLHVDDDLPRPRLGIRELLDAQQ
jgi:hypothetical protein